jgi:uncharacterized protein (DUF1330 family)
MPITPNKDQFMAFATAERAGEVVMLNLLKFKKKADSGDGSGADAYSRYSAQVSKMVEERGGRMVWLGKAEQVLIGDVASDEWDAVALVAYPNRQAFIDMATSPAYNESHKHREDGLERTVLIACEAVSAESFGR